MPAKKPCMFAKEPCFSSKKGLHFFQTRSTQVCNPLFYQSQISLSVKRALYIYKKALYICKTALYVCKTALHVHKRALYFLEKSMQLCHPHFCRSIWGLSSSLSKKRQMTAKKPSTSTKAVIFGSFPTLPKSTVCRHYQHYQRALCVETMRWLWSLGSIKLSVSFAKEPYKRDNILQKKTII